MDASAITQLSIETTEMSKSAKPIPESCTSPTSDSIKYSVNDHVLLSRNREGIIRFIGGTHFAMGILFGIELTNGAVGKHDGMYDGKRYFRTEAKRGVFVPKKQIRRKMRAKDHKTSYRLKRANSLELKQTYQRKRSCPILTANEIKVTDIKQPKVHKAKLQNGVFPMTESKRSKSPIHNGGKVKINNDKMNKLKQKKKKEMNDSDVFDKIMSENINTENIDTKNKVNKDTKTTKSRTFNRAHSRIADHRKRNKTIHSIPVSFKQFQQSKDVMISNSQTLMLNESESKQCAVEYIPSKRPKHSRFASVTGAIYKKLNFSTHRAKKQKVESAESGNRLFGVDPLKLSATFLVEHEYKSCIPNILIRLRRELFLKNGHLEEGIFRIAPNAVECKQIEDELNENGLLDHLFDEVNGALIANLIKIWFRNMPCPILQDVDAGKIEKIRITQSMDDVESVLKELKEPYVSYFEWLLDLCIDITEHENVNKMSAKNMALVVSPNLFNPSKCENTMQAMAVSMALVKFMELAIERRKIGLKKKEK